MKKAPLAYFLMMVAVTTSPSSYDAKIDHVVSVYDGDTFTAYIAQAPAYMRQMPVRIRGIDTPEINGKCDEEKRLAIESREFLKSKLVGAITLKNIQRDKYFRLLADVDAGGLSISDEIIKYKKGRKYDGRKRQGWC